VDKTHRALVAQLIVRGEGKMKRWLNMIILVAVTAGLIFVSVQAGNAQPQAGQKGERGPGMGMGPGSHGLMNLSSLSDKQLEQMLDLQKEMQFSHIKLMNEQRELMEETRTLSEDPSLNGERLGQVHNRMAAIHLQMDKDRVAQQETMQRILTDAQWEELGVQRAERMKSGSESDRDGRGRGLHGQGGRRMGHGHSSYSMRGSCGHFPRHGHRGMGR
jgi:Spy/CpxP family protein refolding chaperone